MVEAFIIVVLGLVGGLILGLLFSLILQKQVLIFQVLPKEPLN